MSEEENFEKALNSKRPKDVPYGSKTSEYYLTEPTLPERFQNPDNLKGYGLKDCNPMYQTTYSDYGSIAPSVHTMPVIYKGKKEQEFLKIPKKKCLYTTLNMAELEKY